MNILNIAINQGCFKGVGYFSLLIVCDVDILGGWIINGEKKLT